MSEQKPHIRDAEIDEILEQVQQKRGDARPVQGTDAELDAILAELGISPQQKREKPEPVLLPEPEFVRSKKRAARRTEPAPKAGASPEGSPAFGNEAAPQAAAPRSAAARPGEKARPAAQSTASRPEQLGAQAEKPTVELPNIKAYSQAEAQKHAEERARLLEQARHEAEQKLRETARAGQPVAAQPVRPRQEDAVPAERPEKAAGTPEHRTNPVPTARRGAETPVVTGNNLFGEVDDRFRDFFSSTVIDDPTQKEQSHRKKDKGGLWAKLFAKRDDDAKEDGFEPGGEGEYYEAAQEEGFSEAFDAIRRGQATPGQEDAGAEAQPRTAVWTDPGTAPLSASIVARAITGTDSFAFGSTRSAHGFAVDVDLPLSGDGTAEYEKQRGTGDALSPEEDLEEYSSLSDAPMVAGELAAMRQTRMVRTVFTGALALFLIYLGLSARVEWLKPIPALDPHTAPLAYLVTNFALLAVTAFSSITTIGAGLRGLVQRPTVDSFAALATVSAALQNAAYLFGAKTFDPDAVTLFAPVAALLLCGNALGKWMQLRAVCANFALASSGEEHAAAFLLEKEQLARRLCDGLGEGEPCLLLNRPTALVKGFLSQSFSARPLDDGAQKLCWALSAAALVCAIAAGLKGGIPTALSGFAGALALGAPLAATVCYALPAQLLQGAAARCGAVVPGPSAVRALGSANTVLLRARDLFPAGSVRLHGIKTFEKERIDIAILYAASLLSVRCETLRGVFMGMLDNNEKLLAKVENATTEIGCGFTGWIDGKRVLLGNREMMRRHDIELPSLDYENRYTKNGQRSPIYLAVSGKLFGMFLVSYRPSRRAAEAMNRLADSGANVLIQAEDFNITAQLVAEAYALPDSMVKVLTQAEQDALETELAYRPESEGVMIHNGSCASLLGGLYVAARVAAGERLAGFTLAAAVAMGAVASAAISFSQGLAGLSLGLVLAYQLVWSAAVAAASLLKKP